MKRPDETIALELVGNLFRGRVDAFERLEVTSSILEPCSAIFEMGDEGSASLLDVLIHGAKARVFVNDKPILKGWIIAREPQLRDDGIVATFKVETIIGLAAMASAEPKIKTTGVTLRTFLETIYRPIVQPIYGSTFSIQTGFDFVTSASLERNLLTGVGARGERAPATLTTALGEQAKPQPPATVYEGAAMNLRRFSMGHWDTPGGNVYVGRPDEDQLPIGKLVMKADPKLSRANNVLEGRIFQDWSDVPSVVRTHGTFASPAQLFRPINGRADNTEVQASGLYRPIIVKGEANRNVAQVNAQALRELATRSKRQDALELRVDGWSWWNGSSLIPFSPNTMWDVDLDILGGIVGPYLCLTVKRSLDVSAGPTTTLFLTRKGTFSF
jgi:prophage tail gpP-like protein